MIALITIISQAAASSIGTKIEPYWKTLQGMTLMLHKRASKSKAGTVVSQGKHSPQKEEGRLMDPGPPFYRLRFV